jgi:hypothetical protein
MTPDFQEVYRSLFQDAKFDTVLRRDNDFEARKLGLVSVRHLEEKGLHLHPEKRDQLVQSLLGGDFNNAQCILQETKKFASVRAFFSAVLSSPSDGRLLKKEMKSLAADLSDSQFLLQMKGVQDEALHPMIRDIEVLSYSLLSSSIDATVGAMTGAVVAMQKEVSKTTIRHEIESEEMKLRNEALEDLIRKINARSVGRKDLCVF